MAGFAKGSADVELTEADGNSTVLAYPFKTGKELLTHCTTQQLSFSQVMLANEAAWRPEAETRAGRRLTHPSHFPHDRAASRIAIRAFITPCSDPRPAGVPKASCNWQYRE